MDTPTGTLTQYKMFIGGEWVEAATGEHFPSDNPFTGKLTGTSNANEFVAQRSAKSHIPMAKLQIGFANPRSYNVNENLSVL